MSFSLINNSSKYIEQKQDSVVFKILLSRILLLSTLFLSLNAAALVVNRGPYLQTETSSSIILRWRTDTATDSVVRYGISPSQLNSTMPVTGSQTEHSVTLSGLAADTRYYYSVGNSAGELEGGSINYSFTTAPTAGTAKPTRIWVIGDSGTGNSSARAVRDAYKSFTGSTPTDLWLMLGDNAYNAGTDSEYQTAVFDTYPELLQQIVVWPVLGNHDGSSSDSATESGPYYDIFNLPRAGEAGGLATGTEAYYAFDYGNIHFIALDSFETDRSVGGAMLTWLENDLLANDKPWVIAFWHHPPYTKGSHNSDTESRLIDMRQNALPILESYGVDLVLSGHSHAYERSMLIDGHYGQSTSLTSAMILNSGSGRANTADGAYSKTNGVAVANEGAVYAVAGSSGKISGGALNHPAMYISLNLLGSMVIDVNDNQMDTVFLDSSGIVQDHFTLIKGTDIIPPSITSVTSDNSASVLVEFSETVDQSSAETVSNYTIDQGIDITDATLQAGSRSVVLTTSTLLSDNPYTLTVNQVTDNALNPIAPNSQTLFSFLSIQSISFQNGVWPGINYQGVIDTYISENSATTNYGITTDLQADGDDPGGTGRDLATLLRWDINAIPQGAVIQSATIELNVFNPSQNSYPIYELFTDWLETEASWNQSENAQSWASAGAKGSTDRGTTILGNLSASSTGSYTISLNADGLNTLQTWVDGTSPNHGFIIASSTSSDGIDFSSSNTSIPTLRPKLNITYSVPGGSNDTEAPTVPLNLVSTAITATSATLSWDASNDNVGIAGYKLFRDSTLIADLNATSFFDSGLQAGQTYLYSVSAYDFAGNESTLSTTLSVSTPNSGSIDVRIIQSTDDAEERSDGSMYLNSSDLELTTDGSLVQTVGMRFTNIQLPPNATILNAYVQFEVDETNSGSTFLTIHGEDVADSISFGSASNNITSRPLTSASVLWNPVPWTVVNDQTLDQRTPDLSIIIEEIITRPNWQTGNDVAIIISGTGERTAESYDGEQAAAPLLHIEYTLDPPENQAPVVSAGGNLSVQLPSTATLSTATATDDGLLNSTLVLNWSVLTRPTGSSVVITSPSDLNPTVEFDLPGIYTLQLSADDGELISSDSMDLTVLAGNQAPTAQFSSTPQQGNAPLTVSFDASASNDSDGNIVSYAWDFGDGQSANGVNINHLYNSAGSYSVQLTVTDNQGATAQATTTIIANTVNQSPNAQFSSTPQQGEAPLLVSFDANASTDSDGNIVNYDWDFGDGQNASGVSPDHLFNVSGSYLVQLTVTDNQGATAQATTTIIITALNQPPSAQFSSTPQQGEAPLLVSFDANASTDSDGNIVSYDWDFGDSQNGSGIILDHLYSSPGSYLVQLTVTDNQGATAQATTTITVNPVQVGIVSEHDVIAGVSNQQWTTVNLSNQYNSMVVIATPVYDNSSAPLVTRIRNAVGNSFEVQVQQANDSAITVTGIDVHYLVVEEGVYNVVDHGVKLEAVKYISTTTDSDSHWVGEDRTYLNSYTNPVVLGQVMTKNDDHFSVFWARGTHRSRAPVATTLFTGKHVAEHAISSRADETIGYLVIEAGQGNLAGSVFHAGLGADSIRGVSNNPPYSYALTGLSSATTAVLSSAAMDGVNGGWPVLYGVNPVTSSTLNLVIDEDQFKDTERKHTTEQVAFIVLE